MAVKGKGGGKHVKTKTLKRLGKLSKKGRLKRSAKDQLKAIKSKQMEGAALFQNQVRILEMLTQTQGQ